jgi:hypothetical protein
MEEEDIEDIIAPDPNDDKQSNCMKPFWTFIKHKRSDGNEILLLQNGELLHSDPVEKNQHSKQPVSISILREIRIYKDRFPKTM